MIPTIKQKIAELEEEEKELLLWFDMYNENHLLFNLKKLMLEKCQAKLAVWKEALKLAKNTENRINKLIDYNELSIMTTRDNAEGNKRILGLCTEIRNREKSIKEAFGGQT